MSTSVKAHQIFVDNGYWDAYISDKETAKEVTGDLLLMFAASILNMNKIDSDEDGIREAADVLFTLLAIAGALGIHIELEDMPPVSMESPADVFISVRKLLMSFLTTGKLSFDDVAVVVEDFYALYGKTVVISAVEETMSRSYGRKATRASLEMEIVGSMAKQFNLF